MSNSMSWLGIYLLIVWTVMSSAVITCQIPNKAVKVMHGPEQVPIKVVKREIAFSSSMHHNNIVRLLDVFAEGKRLIIVWELISGPDLLDLLNENGGCLAEPLACFYFLQLLEAVTFMHENGFCHRDIKPENCMVQRSTHRLKLIDFGLSKHLQSAHTLGVGTPDYMCPELLTQHSWTTLQSLSAAAFSPTTAPPSAPSYDARAVDAWAMGVLMYLLTTGKYPFEDPKFPNNLARTITNVLAVRVQPFPQSMSAGCRHVIAGLLQKDPLKRTTLIDLKKSSWVREQAYLHASKIGRIDLLEVSHGMTTDQPEDEAPTGVLSVQASLEHSEIESYSKEGPPRSSVSADTREELGCKGLLHAGGKVEGGVVTSTDTVASRSQVDVTSKTYLQRVYSYFKRLWGAH